MRQILFIISIFSLFVGSCSDVGQWKFLDEGLSFIQFSLPGPITVISGKVDVLKIDPNFYQLQLLCSSQYEHKTRTVREWCEDFHLTAAINAGMYKTDSITSVGYMKNFTYLNNDHIVQDYMAVLAFNPVYDSLPSVQIIDLELQNFENLKRGYNSLVQSIRMIDIHGANVWHQQPQKHSIAALAMDKDGNVLFIFCEQPSSVHDFINFMLELPLSIYNAIYLEGGPPAQFYLKSTNLKIDRKGQDSYSTSILLSEYAIPNVIGIMKKTTLK